MADKIHGGAFLISRALFQSDIWTNKPASWCKLWIYIIGKVSYSDNGKYPRGSGHFNLTAEMRAINQDFTSDGTKKCISYLKRMNMISTKRSTRGMIITILKYNDFQSLDNYSSTTESTVKSTRQAPDKHQTSTPYIIEEVKKIRNKETNTLVVEFLDYFNLKTKKSLTLTLARKTIVESRLNTHTLSQLKAAVDNFARDDWPDRHRYMDVVYCIGTRNKIDNLEKWLNYSNRTATNSNESKPFPKDN